MPAAAMVGAFGHGDFLKPHLKPLQAPHPPIGVAGLSKGSDTLKPAGERGYIPMARAATQMFN